MTLIPFLFDILNIPSPTFQEQAITQFIEDWLDHRIPDLFVRRQGNNRIFSLPLIENLPHIALVGHSDVVPPHFCPYQRSQRLHGAGASDMQGSLAVFAFLMYDFSQITDRQFNFSFILYDAEEGTPIEQNGLHKLIETESDFIRNIDLSIVGEPTNGEAQIGCVGSLHAQVIVQGQACHSARPWDGQNALYNAIPFIKEISKITPVKQVVGGVDFFDVLNITESQSQNGRTTIPGEWTCNINYRYAPGRDMIEAESTFDSLFRQAASIVTDSINYKIVDHVPAAQIIENHLFNQVISWSGAKITAKQAWTDVAQLNGIGVPAFNFGPGLTSQAHKPDEYILVEDVLNYYQLLQGLANLKVTANQIYQEN